LNVIPTGKHFGAGRGLPPASTWRLAKVGSNLADMLAVGKRGTDGRQKWRRMCWSDGRNKIGMVMDDSFSGLANSGWGCHSSYVLGPDISKSHVYTDEKAYSNMYTFNTKIVLYIQYLKGMNCGASKPALARARIIFM
jgi:hypothetical protein